MSNRNGYTDYQYTGGGSNGLSFVMVVIPVLLVIATLWSLGYIPFP